jgi:GT2 family glycosyltransferase
MSMRLSQSQQSIKRYNERSDTLSVMLISFVIPTRNRSSELGFTLGQLEKLDIEDLGGQSEVVIVDNGSNTSVDLPAELSNGIRVIRVGLNENIGAGARNIGVAHAGGQWIIMLDDDSNLLPGPVGAYLSGLEPSIGAVGGEIFLPGGRHEAGGLPEVIVGCGCAIRRDVFLEIGGYDARFGYYAEEYDLCAKLISNGYRIKHTDALGFIHRKCATGRDMDEILFRLVRNNGWVIQRYAPDDLLDDALTEMKNRYKLIADNEQAIEGYLRGIDELNRTMDDQDRVALGIIEWERFVGLSAMRISIEPMLQEHASGRAVIVGPARGKGLRQIRGVIESCGITIIDDGGDANDLRVIGSLSPGPMLDARNAYPDAICPWMIEELALTGSHV